MKSILSSLVYTSLSLSLLSLSASAKESDWGLLLKFSKDFNQRFAGSKSESESAQWLIAQYQSLGFKVKQHEFSFSLNGNVLESKNIEVELPGKSVKTLVIGAHYDLIGHQIGSAGLSDNASGTISLLALAKRLKEQEHHYTIRLVSFGAEEVGLQGSRSYLSSPYIDKKNIIGMINLDTVIGGDKLYIHSAHSSPYKCEQTAKSSDKKYNSDVWLRDSLLSTSKKLTNIEPYSLHPDTPNYAAGETGDWSDHAPFSCNGVAIAYIEATNFMIDGESGYDGYSQSVNPKLWSCFDDTKQTTCDKSKEKHWGKIWHTGFDQEKHLLAIMEDKIKSQFLSNIELLYQFILHGQSSAE
ncbi:M28 family metallopeptidase [Thalassotalea crassostreae]|uniref:M28 family metallopeptidase n=1 Tax=Thalassotalea crassostreae TaxID=1763536 RepID=UPI000837B6DC|nr:M28 family peptidase [Thalassotalea crassostreae]